MNVSVGPDGGAEAGGSVGAKIGASVGSKVSSLGARLGVEETGHNMYFNSVTANSVGPATIKELTYLSLLSKL